MSSAVKDVLQTPLEVAQQVSGAIQAIQSPTLAEYTAPTRLAPIVLIDKRVLGMDAEHVRSLEQTALSIYCAYYLQAVNLAMTVGNVKVMRLLDQFSTDRSLINAAGNSMFWAGESIKENQCSFPGYSLEHDSMFPHEHTADSSWAPPSFARPMEHTKAKASDNDKAIHNITDESNLVVGKILDVKLTEGDNSITIPVSVTLNPKGIDSEDFLAICKANSTDHSWMARWHQWRSGEIRFVKDFLLAQDLIDANKKALMADKTHSLLSIRSKRTKGIFSALISGYASPNAVSTMIFISKQTANDMELTLRGKLHNHHVREQYFQNSSTMMLVVVDAIMERFTIYQRGIADYREHTFEDIKGANKKTNAGGDIESILRSYKLGASASI